MAALSNPFLSPSNPRRAASSLLAAALCLMTTAALPAQAPRDPYAQDPPNRVARIAYAQGNVSLEPSGADYFGAAELNYPLSIGDRIYADLDAVSELQSSGLAVRLGNGADFTITSLTDGVAQFALAQGSVHLVTRDLYAPPAPDGSPQTADVEVDTPNTTVLVRQQGDIRVDFYPQDSSTVVTVDYGQVEVSGPGFDQMVSQGQSIHLRGVDQIYPEWVQVLPPDQLDSFDSQREQQRDNSQAFRNHYVDPEMIGAADLDQYGDWQPSQQYGPVWFPRNVQYGWTPYSAGHWANIPPWGYTWVDNEPWGFAPFHYGRWNNFGGRWGWVPGPPPSIFRGDEWHGHPPRPVYSPALVAFVGGGGPGGGGFSLSLSIGGGGGGGVTAWFPLGPSEPYVPWYHTSPAYVNRVNVTNVYNTNVTEIHNTYINKTTTVYNVTNVTYVNRNTATVVVNQNDFAAGHSVAKSQVQLTPAVKAQLVSAPVLTHSVPPPPRVAAPPREAAKAVPASVARPVVQTKQGFQRAGAPPAPTPLKAPTPPPASAAAKAAMPAPRTPQVIAPAKPGVAGPPAAAAPVSRPGTAPVAPAAKAPAAAPIERGTPIPPSRPVPPATAAPGRPTNPAATTPAPVVRAPAQPSIPTRPQPAAPTRPITPPTTAPARPVAPAPPAPAARPVTPAPPTRTVTPPPAKVPLTAPKPTTETVPLKKPVPTPPVKLKDPKAQDEKQRDDKAKDDKQRDERPN